MAGRKVQAYAYSKERDLDNSLEVNRRVLKLNQTGGRDLPLENEVRFVEVVSIRAGTDNKQATAKEVQYNATTRVFEDPTGPWLYNSDNAETTDLTTTDIFSSEPLAVGDVVEIFGNDDKSDSLQWMVRQSGGGSSLIWITTDNTGLSFDDGATYDRPEGTGTALTVDDTYFIATPWNTRIAAPNNFFGYFVQDGTNWYHNIDKFYVKSNSAYPSGAGAGITSFTCFLNNADTSLNLGTNTAFPAGIKLILSGFDNVNAGSASLNYFSGKVFPASFDSAANIIYLDHPRF